MIFGEQLGLEVVKRVQLLLLNRESKLIAQKLHVLIELHAIHNVFQ